MFILKMEIQTKIYNSNRIIKAIRGNKEKYDVLKKLSQDIIEVRKDKKKQEEFVEKSYSIVLKNLSSSKKDVVINNTTYSISKTGISRKSSNYAENIARGEFFEGLTEVKRNLQVFLKKLSSSKQTILKRFMEKAYMLEEKKPSSMRLGTEIEWISGKKKVEEIRILYNRVNEVKIIIGHEDWRADTVNTVDLDFRDYGIIEQLYNQVKKLLENELKQNLKEYENIKKFLTDIDTKFATYIQSVETLTELRK